MTKTTSMITGIFGILLIYVVSFNSQESITIHDTVNGVTEVSCTGGCTFSPGWFNTTICDGDARCIQMSGIFSEKTK